MRTREVKVGMWVWTQGTEPDDWYLCRVLERTNEGEWLLSSPDHGYAITRGARELKSIKKRKARP